MKDVKVRKYKKKNGYSYTFGMFPTLELIKIKPTKVIKILLSDKANKSPYLEKIIRLCRINNIKFQFADKQISKIAYKENTYAAGVFEKFETSLDSLANHIVLDSPSDMGNLGTIVRTMIGFGIKDLAIIKPAADIFDPRVVRSSMGALFQINFKYYDSFQLYKNDFEFHNPYTFMLNGKTELSKATFNKPFSLVFGNEGQGLDPMFANIGKSVYIKHSKGIDSLNLANAVSIALYVSNN